MSSTGFPIVVPRDEDILQMKINLAMSKSDPLHVDSPADVVMKRSPVPRECIVSCSPGLLTEEDKENKSPAIVGDATTTIKTCTASSTTSLPHAPDTSNANQLFTHDTMDLTEFDLDLSAELDLTNNCERFFDDNQLRAINDAFCAIDTKNTGQIPLYPGLEQLLIELGHPLPEHHISFLIQEMETTPAYVQDEKSPFSTDHSSASRRSSDSDDLAQRFFSQKAILSGLTKLALMNAPQITCDDTDHHYQPSPMHPCSPPVGAEDGTPLQDLPGDSIGGGNLLLTPSKLYASLNVSGSGSHIMGTSFDEYDNTNHRLYLEELSMEEMSGRSCRVEGTGHRLFVEEKDRTVYSPTKTDVRHFGEAASPPDYSEGVEALVALADVSNKPVLKTPPQKKRMPLESNVSFSKTNLISPRARTLPAYQNLQHRHRELTEMYDAAISCLHEAESENKELLIKLQSAVKTEEKFKTLQQEHEALKVDMNDVSESLEAKSKRVNELQNQVVGLKAALSKNQSLLDEALEEKMQLKKKLSEEITVVSTQPPSPTKEMVGLREDIKNLKAQEAELASLVDKLKAENVKMRDSLDESESKAMEAKKEATFFSRLAQSPRRVQKIATPSRALSEEIRLVPVTPYSPRKTAERDPKKLIRNLMGAGLSEEEKVMRSIQEIVASSIAKVADNNIPQQPSLKELGSWVEFLQNVIKQYSNRSPPGNDNDPLPLSGEIYCSDNLTEATCCMARRCLHYLLIVHSCHTREKMDHSSQARLSPEDMLNALSVVYRGQFNGMFAGELRIKAMGKTSTVTNCLSEPMKDELDLVEDVEALALTDPEMCEEDNVSSQMFSAHTHPVLIFGVLMGLLSRFVLVLLVPVFETDGGAVGIHPT